MQLAFMFGIFYHTSVDLGLGQVDLNEVFALKSESKLGVIEL